MLNTSSPSVSQEGRKSLFCSFILFRLYGMMRTNVLRSLLRRLVLRLEGGPVLSVTARAIFLKYHGVEVGMYTVGPCEEHPGRFPPGTTIGRYSSIYWTARVVSDSAQSNSKRSQVRNADPAQDCNQSEDSVRFKLDIGHYVFVGHNAIILSSAGRIGDGAYIGAGAVVQNPVPPYGVVIGNPQEW